MKGVGVTQHKKSTSIRLITALVFLLLLTLPGSTLADTPEEIEYYEILEESMLLGGDLAVGLGVVAQEYANENITKSDALILLTTLHTAASEEHSKFLKLNVPDTYAMVNHYWKEALLDMGNSLLLFKDSIEYDNPSAVDLSVEYLNSYSYNQDRALEFLGIWESGEVVDDTGVDGDGSDGDNKVPGFGIELMLVAGFISLVLVGMRKRV